MQRNLLLLVAISATIVVSCKKDATEVDFTTLDAPQEYQLHSAQADGSVSLKWDDLQMICLLAPCPPTITPVKYQVFISEGGAEDFRLYTQLPPNKTELTIGGLANGKPYLFQVVVIGRRDSVVTTNRIMTAPTSAHISDVMQLQRPGDVSRSYDGRFDAVTTRSSSAGTLVIREGQSPEVVVRGNAQAPVWAPVDYRLAYQTSDGLTGPTYPEHIYVYDVEQGKHRQIVGGQRRNVEPAWSPDGRSLLFLSDRGGESGGYDIWMVDVADTAKVNRLTTVGATNEVMIGMAPSRSPDGGRIAFTTAPLRDGYTWPYSLRIVEMDADGANRRQLVESEWNDYNPVYAPQGDRVAFFSDRSGSREIWVMTIASGALRQLTYTDDFEQPSYHVRGDLQWSPDGSGLYFTGAKKEAEYGYFYVGSLPLAY